MILGAAHPFFKPLSSGAGSGAPYALLSAVTVPEGATRVAVALVGWSNGSDLTTEPTFGGLDLALAGSVDGYVGQLPRGRVWEREIDPSEWGQALDLLVNDSAYSYSQFGLLLFHNGGAARTAATYRTNADGIDVPLTASAAELGDAVIVIGATRNTAAALITYAGGPDEDEVDSAYPGSGEQFSLHRSVVAQATAAQEIGGTGVLSPAGGGTVDWRAFLAVPLAKPTSQEFAATLAGSGAVAASLAFALSAALAGSSSVVATVQASTGGDGETPGGARRARIGHLFDHTARLWRPVKTLGRVRQEVTTFEIVTSFACAINRPSARLGKVGPGLTTIGERNVYADTSVDLRPRDVLEITAGPETGRRIEIDEVPTNVRGHHLEARARIYAGTLPPDGPPTPSDS